jgi:deoxyribonuclease V
MSGPWAWPSSAAELLRVQARIARAEPAPWHPDRPAREVGGCFVCFPRGPTGAGAAGDPAWAAAALIDRGRTVAIVAVPGAAGASYEAGMLALREGPLLEAAVRALRQRPQVLLVNATGRDHRRGAGLALHLGAVLDLPTVGVTHRPLLAEGDWPAPQRGATSPLRLGTRVVGCWLRTRPSARPLAVHPGWRTDLDTAVAVVLDAAPRTRTPEPLRVARRVAREARAGVFQARDSGDG